MDFAIANRNKLSYSPIPYDFPQAWTNTSSTIGSQRTSTKSTSYQDNGIFKAQKLMSKKIDEGKRMDTLNSSICELKRKRMLREKICQSKAQYKSWREETELKSILIAEKQHRAALLIQRSWRGTLWRIRRLDWLIAQEQRIRDIQFDALMFHVDNLSLNYWNHSLKQIIRIQTWTRMIFARIAFKYNRYRDSAVVLERKRQCALKIQRNWRGQSARELTKQMTFEKFRAEKLEQIRKNLLFLYLKVFWDKRKWMFAVIRENYKRRHDLNKRHPRQRVFNPNRYSVSEEAWPPKLANMEKSFQNITAPKMFMKKLQEEKRIQRYSVQPVFIPQEQSSSPELRKNTTATQGKRFSKNPIQLVAACQRNSRRYTPQPPSNPRKSVLASSRNTPDIGQQDSQGDTDSSLLKKRSREVLISQSQERIRENVKPKNDRKQLFLKFNPPASRIVTPDIDDSSFGQRFTRDTFSSSKRKEPFEPKPPPRPTSSFSRPSVFQLTDSRKSYIASTNSFADGHKSFISSTNSFETGRRKIQKRPRSSLGLNKRKNSLGLNKRQNLRASHDSINQENFPIFKSFDDNRKKRKRALKGSMQPDELRISAILKNI